VLLVVNQYGQPPALLHDPIDISGSRVHGMWLVQDGSQALLAAYDFVEHAGVDRAGNGGGGGRM
jgi:hypothetical protein